MHRFLLAIAFMSFWGGASATRVFSEGPLSIVFHETPCALPQLELAIVAYGSSSIPKATTVTYQGKRLAGCWALDVDGDFISLDEKGNGVVIFSKHVSEAKNST